MNYNLLQVWDLLSLYICSNEQHKDHVIEPAPTAYCRERRHRMKLTPTSPSTIAVDPFPFDQAPLEAAVVYRAACRHRRCATPTRFKAAYFGARPQMATFTFVEMR